MTRAGVASLIRHANVLLSAGDCVGAQQTIGQAWLALGEYSAALAHRGVSPATALSLHKSLSKALVAAGRRCGAQMNPDSLMPPGQRSGAQMGPDALVAPSFRGPGDQIYNSLVTTLTTLGIAGALFGLGYGFWTMYHGGEG